MLRKLEIPMLVDPMEDLANHITSGDLVECPANPEVVIMIGSEFVVTGSPSGAGNFRRHDNVSATRVIYINCDCSKCHLPRKVCNAV